MKSWTLLVLGVLVVAMLAGCAAGPNTTGGSPDGEGKVAGFWAGLWHGCIVMVTFVMSLFSDKVALYEVHNNGAWYDFGFLFGLMIVFGGSGGGASRGRKR